MEQDRYPNARERIVRYFGSVNKFCKKTGIPKASVVRVLKGKYGQRDTDDSRQRKRIEEAMKEHGIPQEEIRNIWAKIQEEGSSSVIVMNGRRFKMTTVITFEDLGNAL